MICAIHRNKLVEIIPQHLHPSFSVVTEVCETTSKIVPVTPWLPLIAEEQLDYRTTRRRLFDSQQWALLRSKIFVQNMFVNGSCSSLFYVVSLSLLCSWFGMTLLQCDRYPLRMGCSTKRFLTPGHGPIEENIGLAELGFGSENSFFIGDQSLISFLHQSVMPIKSSLYRLESRKKKEMKGKVTMTFVKLLI